jgi:uncharacterized membrane protein (UPF0127 family)
MMRAALVALALAAFAECEHAPPEDFPARPVASAASPAAAPEAAGSAAAPPPVAAGRCVLPTPDVAPGTVAPGPAPGCPADPEPGQPAPSMVQVKFPAAGGLTVDSEFVRSEHDTSRGLMYRKSLAPDRGMLFDLRRRDDHKFWMHNTCIPLDMLFIDEDGLVVGIVENAPTLNDEPRGVDCPSRYVLEVNAGWTRRHGVRAGSTLVLPEHHTKLTMPSELVP